MTKEATMADPCEFTIDCDPSTVRLARTGVRSVLSTTPVADDAELITSELATNATLWSASRLEGGTITVVVHYEPGASSARIEVVDAGPLLPDDIARERIEDYGRGLKIVGELASGVGHESREDGSEVWWAELTW